MGGAGTAVVVGTGVVAGVIGGLFGAHAALAPNPCSPGADANV
jgi:hypothetical protein